MNSENNIKSYEELGQVIAKEFVNPKLTLYRYKVVNEGDKKYHFMIFKYGNEQYVSASWWFSEDEDKEELKWINYARLIVNNQLIKYFTKELNKDN